MSFVRTLSFARRIPSVRLLAVRTARRQERALPPSTARLLALKPITFVTVPQVKMSRSTKVAYLKAGPRKMMITVGAQTSWAKECPTGPRFL